MRDLALARIVFHGGETTTLPRGECGAAKDRRQRDRQSVCECTSYLGHDVRSDAAHRDLQREFRHHLICFWQFVEFPSLGHAASEAVCERSRARKRRPRETCGLCGVASGESGLGKCSVWAGPSALRLLPTASSLLFPPTERCGARSRFQRGPILASICDRSRRTRAWRAPRCTQGSGRDFRERARLRFSS